MKKVIWLVSWYPNETETFSGDFIQRQAEAVSIYQPLKVLYIGKYSPKTFSENAEHLGGRKKPQNLEEHILYYSTSENHNPVSKFKSLHAYFKKHLEFIKGLRRKNDLPELVH